MIKTLIIDDEPLARMIVREYLGTHSEFEIVGECGNGLDGFKTIQQVKPDLVFLDVQMPKINGFEMLELLDDKPAIIFTTAFDQYAVKAFEASALDYLLKPFSQERFDQSIEKWKKQASNLSPQIEKASADYHSEQFEERIAIRNGSEITILNADEVMCIEAFDDYVKIFTQNDYFLKKKTISHFEARLDPSKFLRVHRSHILKLDAISRIEAWEKGGHIAILKNKREIPLSRPGYAKLKDQLGMSKG